MGDCIFQYKTCHPSQLFLPLSWILVTVWWIKSNELQIVQLVDKNRRLLRTTFWIEIQWDAVKYNYYRATTLKWGKVNNWKLWISGINNSLFCCPNDKELWQIERKHEESKFNWMQQFIFDVLLIIYKQSSTICAVNHDIKDAQGHVNMIRGSVVCTVYCMHYFNSSTLTFANSI